MGKNLKKSKTFRFSDGELALLESLKGDGNYTETIVEALHALRDRNRNQPTNAELLAILAERLK